MIRRVSAWEEIPTRTIFCSLHRERIKCLKKRSRHRLSTNYRGRGPPPNYTTKAEVPPDPSVPWKPGTSATGSSQWNSNWTQRPKITAMMIQIKPRSRMQWWKTTKCRRYNPSSFSSRRMWSTIPLEMTADSTWHRIPSHHLECKSDKTAKVFPWCPTSPTEASASIRFPKARNTLNKNL